MFARLIIKRGARHEGESPFWISFSDLMSALMILFLVVMAVTLIAVTRSVTAEEEQKIQRDKDIRELMSRTREVSQQFPQVRVDAATNRIDLGEVVRFESGRHDISPTGARFLRHFVPELLRALAADREKGWVRRVVVEGFTDQDGTYLYNLDLSLNRSRSVVCALFAKEGADERPLSEEQKRQIRDLFLVGGYSFNSIQATKEESRRVELKIEFWAISERPTVGPPIERKEFGQCRA